MLLLLLLLGLHLIISAHEITRLLLRFMRGFRPSTADILPEYVGAAQRRNMLSH